MLSVDGSFVNQLRNCDFIAFSLEPWKSTARRFLNISQYFYEYPA